MAVYSPALRYMIALVALTGCQTVGGPALVSAWTHYDNCAAITPAFTEMVACGKQRRMNYCVPINACGEEGNTFVQYADALALSVTNRELTESQARLKFIEYKAALMSEISRQSAIRDAAILSSGPKTCHVIGNIVNCY